MLGHWPLKFCPIDAKLIANQICFTESSMETSIYYDQVAHFPISLRTVAICLLLSLPTAAVFGFLTGKYRRASLLAAGKPVDQVVGETTLGAVLALLSLLLAFSFGNALSLAQERKAVLVKEAATLGTAFLHADYLPEPGRTKLRTALLEYAETRLLKDHETLRSLGAVQRFIGTSLEAQSKLWPITLEATSDPVPPPVKTFVAKSVTEVLDAHLDRTRTFSNPLSHVTQLMILSLALASLFLLGNRAGHVGRELSWRTFVFSGFLFAVLITISDTIRAVEGSVRTDTTAMDVTIFEMRVALSGGS